MKNFSLRPGHWFSALALILLVVGLNLPDRNAPKPSAAAPGITVTAYRVVSTPDDQHLEPFSVRLPRNAEPMVGSLRVMTLLPRDESPFPPGTQVLSVTLRDAGVAWADFNAALVAHFPGGSGRESLLLLAILRTLGQFPGVRAVQITVEGKPIESIGGHEEISGPQAVPAPAQSDQRPAKNEKK